MIDKIEHYAIENHATIYDEEALTSLQLAARAAAKVNECIDEIRTIPHKIAVDVDAHIKNGAFDEQIDAHTVELTAEIKQTEEDFEAAVNASNAQLNASITNVETTLSKRISNLAKLREGSTTGDAELTDARVGADGTIYDTAGDAIRKQTLQHTPNIIFYNHILEVTLTSQSVTIAQHNTTNTNLLFGINRRDKGTEIPSLIPTSTTINYANVTGAVGIWMSLATPDYATFFAKGVASTGHNPSATDYLLCVIYGGNVYPVSLNAQCIKVNGTPLLKTPDGIRGNYSTKFIMFRGKLTVDAVNHTIEIPSGSYYGMPFYAAGVHVAESAISITFAVSSLVHYVLFNCVNKALSIRDRNYVFRDDCICLGYLYSGEFTPLEIPSSCVRYKQAKAELKSGHLFMADFWAGLTNPDVTTKITLVGDSITMGAGGTGYAQTGELILDNGSTKYYRNDNGYCWANLFKAYIENNFNATVTNNGISGYFTGTIDRYKSTLIPADSDLVILTIGTNNRSAIPSYQITTRETALAAYYDHMVSIIDYCKSLGIPILLCTCIPNTKENETVTTTRLVHMFELNNIVARLASEYDMDYADIYKEMYYYFHDKGLTYSDYLADGLHPNDAGHKILFERYLKAFGLCADYEEVN